MIKQTLLAVGVLSAFCMSYPANAAVAAHAIAPPAQINGLKIQPNYLTGVEMSSMPMSAMSPDDIHLEADVHATKAEAHGFPDGAWMPYLTIKYTLTKDGSPFKVTGVLMPMVAKVGPHYANEVKMAGAGTYQLNYEISPPSLGVMVLHTDADTGVPDWWKPFTEHWSFKYPIGN